jgi:hypothetical protein
MGVFPTKYPFNITSAPEGSDLTKIVLVPAGVNELNKLIIKTIAKFFM